MDWGLYYRYMELLLDINSIQILDEENSRSDDFFVQLRSIEYQTTRLAANPNFEKMKDSMQNIMEEKGTDLMTAVVRFFNSALLHFSENFPG
jgi:hypothetical protein